MIVVDASVLANAIGDDGSEGELARHALLEHRTLCAPDLVDVETVAVLRQRWLSGDVSDGRFADAVADLTDLDMERFPTLPLMPRAFELRANVSPYDATYVALAEALDCPLLTADRRLTRAPGVRCECQLLTGGA